MQVLKALPEPGDMLTVTNVQLTHAIARPKDPRVSST
jgi:hypothetical protein